MNMKREIQKMLSKSNSLPTLFVGSGLSRRYLNTPDWKGLLKHFCNYLPTSYGQYLSKATLECRDSQDMILPLVATYIEKDFNEVWFTHPDFEEERKTHTRDIDHGIPPLKISVAKFFKKNSTLFSHTYETEIQKLQAIGNKHISSIITTNYDLFFENCFERNSFQTYIGQNELLFSPIMELAEIYKIHGCCTQPSSIIIDSYDYQTFNSKCAYLSAKLLTIFLENPIIFIGYSLNDPNIKRILSSISNCLETDQLETLKERLIFVEWNDTSDKQDYISEKTFSFDNGKSISMQSVYLSDYGDLYDAIASNYVKYEVKSLRRIKEQLYELVKTNKPTEKLYIATSLENSNEDVDFVVGVGVYSKFGQVGYKGLNLNQLYRYVLGISELKYDDNAILKDSIPKLYNGKSTLPVCKLLSCCTDLSSISERSRNSFKDSIKEMLNSSQTSQIKNGYFDMKCKITTYYASHNLSKTLSKIPLLNPNLIDKDDLYAFLLKALDDEPTLLNTDKTIKNPSDSAFRKCISIWDWLQYHSDAQNNLNHLEQSKLQ